PQTSDDILHYTESNRRAWNEIAQVRSTTQPPAEFFAEGHSTLDERELQAAGDVRGRRLLHLQCATGQDTLSSAVAGGEASGLDSSEQSIELARQKAEAAGLSARFVAANVYALPPDLQQGDFDIVHTSTGVMVWLPDLPKWASTIAAALKVGGIF